VETLQELVLSLEGKEGTAKSWKKDGKIVGEDYASYFEKIVALSRGFLNLGIRKGDHVGYIADNNPDWVAISLALNAIGAVDIPRGSDSTADEMKYILSHGDAKHLIINNQKSHEKFRDAQGSKIKTVVTLDNSHDTPLSEILIHGRRSGKELPNVSGKDLSGIIYTSGTTGRPKGVMLSHENFLSNFPLLAEIQNMNSDDVWMSVLPPPHVFQRVAEYCALFTGAEMYHTGVAQVGEDLKLVRPTILPSVPRVWESIYAKGVKKLKQEVERKKWPVKKIMQVLVPGIIPGKIVPKAIGEKVQENLGGRLRFAVSGGGALPHYIDDFFRRAGIEVLEGYGMTETSPVISARTLGEGGKARYTVGSPLPKVEVKIADPDTNEALLAHSYGEVQVSGPLVMQGYYKDEEATNEAITKDGWLKTGDLGYIDDAGYLYIKGRSKNMMLGPSGQNIYPEELEAKIANLPCVQECVVKMSNNKLIAMIYPDRESMECNKEDFQDINKRMKDLLADLNKGLPRYEQITDVEIVDEEFVKTPKKNIKRYLYT